MNFGWVVFGFIIILFSLAVLTGREKKVVRERGVIEVTEVIGRGVTEVTGRGGTEVKGGRGVGTEEKGVEVGMEEVKAEDDNSTTSKIGPLDQVCII